MLFFKELQRNEKRNEIFISFPFCWKSYRSHVSEGNEIYSVINTYKNLFLKIKVISLCK